MPVTTTYSPDGHGVIFSCHGAVTAVEAIVAKAAVPKDFSPAAHCYQLMDCSDASDCNDLASNIQSVAMCDSASCAHRPSSLFLLVGPHSLLASWMRLYGVYLDVWARPLGFRTFDRMEEAHAWIDYHVRQGTFEPVPEPAT